MKDSRSHLGVLGLVVGVLLAVFYVGYNNPVRLGLDLQGGLEIVLKASPRADERLTNEQLEESVEVIRSRVDALGVAEPQIRLQGTDQIAVELPGETDPDRAVGVVGSTAQLFFYDFEERLVGDRAYRDSYQLLRRHQTRAEQLVKKGEQVDAWMLYDGEGRELGGPAPTRERLLDDYEGELPDDHQVLMVPPGHVMVHGMPDRVNVQVDEAGRLDRTRGVFMLLEDEPALSGTQIRSATPSTQQGGWVTNIVFTGEGGRQFGEVTREIAQRGALRGYPQSFAIVLDDEIKSAPTIDYRRYPNGIQGTQAQITGLDDRQEAEDLALVLNSGALPVRFEVISKTQVSASLGQQSLQQGLLAGAAGLAVTMLYMLVFYRLLGLIANIALLAYAFIFYGIIVGVPITLTLPGIAGMILTIGVAADANIVIFERIREEFRAGRSIRAAITAGYSKGLRTIFDANMVVLITAFLLFIVGSGSVRGFALLLAVGVLLSLFTAVAATFAMLGLLGRTRLMKHPAVIGGSRKGRRFNVPWMRLRTLAVRLATFIVVASVLTVGLNGLNLGIDFRSGTKFNVTVPEQVTPEDVRQTIRPVDSAFANATIQETRDPAGGDADEDGSSFTISSERLSEDAEEQQRAERDVRRALEAQFGELESFNVQTIGPSFGQQVALGALVAILLSIAFQMVYISMRFERTYAIPVVITLVHDIALVTAVYSLTGREFTAATVAALLTILGYSLYDTIIIFDRIRENVGVLRKSSFARITETSLNEVLTRSINTSVSTLLPLLALYFYGGETLRDFAFALIVGIVAGAWSSLMVAAPLLSWLKEREPAWQRRIGMNDPRQPVVVAAGGEGAPNGRAKVSRGVAAGGDGPSAGADEAAGGDGSAAEAAGEHNEQVGSTTGRGAGYASSTGPAARRRDRRSRADRKKQ